MIILLALGCISVGGSDGFAIANAVLIHAASSPVVQSRNRTVLFAWGGGEPEYIQPSDVNVAEEQHFTDAEMCVRLTEEWAANGYGSDAVYTAEGSMYTNNMTLYFSNNGHAGTAEVSECTDVCTVDMLELDAAALNIHGDRGHITAKSGSKLIVDLTLPLCLVDY